MAAASCRRPYAERLAPWLSNRQRRDLTHVSDVARAVELALRWQGTGAVGLNVGTGKNHSVMDMLETATKTAATTHLPGVCPSHFTPVVEHQNAHPADVPETLASLEQVRLELGWSPRIFFPDHPADPAGRNGKDRQLETVVKHN